MTAAISRFDLVRRVTPVVKTDFKKLQRGPVRSPLETDDEFARRIAGDKINKILFEQHRLKFEIFKGLPRELRADIFVKALNAELQNKNGVEVWLNAISVHTKDISGFI